METKFTKGEWKVARLGPSNKSIWHVHTNKPNYSNEICTLFIGSDEQILANAKLIAAAPEMLEALIRVKQYLIENSDILAPFPTRSELDNINSAIQKATK